MSCDPRCVSRDATERVNRSFEQFNSDIFYARVLLRHHVVLRCPRQRGILHSLDSSSKAMFLFNNVLYFFCLKFTRTVWFSHNSAHNYSEPILINIHNTYAIAFHNSSTVTFYCFNKTKFDTTVIHILPVYFILNHFCYWCFY